MIFPGAASPPWDSILFYEMHPARSALGAPFGGAGSPNGLTEGVSFDEWESEFLSAYRSASRVSEVLCETGACIAIAAHSLSFANAQQFPQRGS